MIEGLAQIFIFISVRNVSLKNFLTPWLFHFLRNPPLKCFWL